MLLTLCIQDNNAQGQITFSLEERNGRHSGFRGWSLASVVTKTASQSIFGVVSKCVSWGWDRAKAKTRNSTGDRARLDGVHYTGRYHRPALDVLRIFALLCVLLLHALAKKRKSLNLRRMVAPNPLNPSILPLLAAESHDLLIVPGISEPVEGLIFGTI